MTKAKLLKLLAQAQHRAATDPDPSVRHKAEQSARSLSERLQADKRYKHAKL